MRATVYSRSKSQPRMNWRILRPNSVVRCNRAATACIDLSDGLADAVRQIAEASRVGIAVDEAAIPGAAAAAAFHSDDYELLFTVRPSSRSRLRAVESQAGDLPITRIGIVTTGDRVVVRTPSGERELPTGFEHFR